MLRKVLPEWTVFMNFCEVLEQLDSIKEGEGTHQTTQSLLWVLALEMENTIQWMSFLCAGSANGKIKTGRN